MQKYAHCIVLCSLHTSCLKNTIQFSSLSLSIVRDALWRENGYHSCNISLDSEGEETGNEQEEFTPSGGGDGFNSDDEQSTSNHRQIHYVVGDVTKPQNTNNEEAIIVHCVGECENLICYDNMCNYVKFNERISPKYDFVMFIRITYFMSLILIRSN